MSEEYTKVVRKGWGTRIVESFWGVVLGIALFLGSFAVLWVNEGRIDMAKIAGLGEPVDPSVIETEFEGKLISVTGQLKVPQMLGDPKYLKPGPYLELTREVEMYAWIEHEETETEKKLGGEEVKTTTYTYKKGWTSGPKPPASFEHPEGHENPSMAVTKRVFSGQEASLGVYEFPPGSVDLPSPTRLSLTSENVILGEETELAGDYIFVGKGSLAKPQLGDIRISFKAVRAGVLATLFGKLKGKSVVPYFHKGRHRLYRVIPGSRETAIAQIAREHRILTWVLRGVGFLMMWAGLSLFFAPINVLLDIVPFLGGLSRGLIRIVTFIVALVLSLVTILISMILHNVFALILVLATLGGVLWWQRKRYLTSSA